jgi:hypothetical protein
MIEDPYCLNIPLTTIDKIQIYGDYIVAIGGILILICANICYNIPLWINYCVPLGFLMGASFEYIQPRIGWVYYYKCDTYKIAPLQIMWIIHSIWDSMLFGIIFTLSYLIWGSSIVSEFNIYIGLFMGLLGMIQEIVIECYQTIWYYKPTKWNPTWAVIRGRDMTLQQWHWSILPMLYYYIVVNKLY